MVANVEEIVPIILPQGKPDLESRPDDEVLPVGSVVLRLQCRRP